MKWFFCIFFIPNLLSSHLYNLTISTLFKNEARWLKEWIEYHRFLGVQHFYLYSNDSTDNYEEVLSPYIKMGLVDLIEWNSDNAPFHDPRQPIQWVGFQLSALNDSIQRAKGIAQWIACIDIDEYIFPVEGKESFQIFLKRTPLEVGSLRLSWQCFGTSYLKELSMNSLVTESLVMRSRDDSHWNQHVKCIHRPEAIQYTLVHKAYLKNNYIFEFIDRSKFRLNHYIARGQQEALIKRRGDLPTFEKLMNEVFDNSMNQYVPFIKKGIWFTKEDWWKKLEEK